MSGDTEYTVVFYGHPRGIKGNPFDVVSDFGKAVVISVGNVCEDADCYRAALEEIAERGDRQASALAQAAMDERDTALKAALDARSAK